MNNLISMVAADGTSEVIPQVGMGATICYWTDRAAGTIVKVTKTQIHVQMDNAQRVDNNGMSDSQSYSYSPDPNGAIRVFRKTKKGWNCHGAGLIIGRRMAYHDYSF